MRNPQHQAPTDMPQPPPASCTLQLGCGALIQGEDLAHHLATECPKRIVPCPLGCPERELWAEEVASHLRDSCPLQMEPCRMGCGVMVAACSRREHEESTCLERIVTCECGTKHAVSKTEDHRRVSFVLRCKRLKVFVTFAS